MWSYCFVPSFCRTWYLLPWNAEFHLISSLEHSTRWLYCCNCWTSHTSMESSQKQQPVHVISFCVFCFPQLYRWSHGLLLSRLAPILFSITCYAFSDHWVLCHSPRTLSYCRFVPRWEERLVLLHIRNQLQVCSASVAILESLLIPVSGLMPHISVAS